MSEESDVTPDEESSQAEERTSGAGLPIAPPMATQRESDKATRPGFRGTANKKSKAMKRKKRKKK